MGAVAQRRDAGPGPPVMRFHPLVRRDAKQALLYYDGISRKLGDDFLGKLEEAVQRIEANPKRFHFDETGWRRANLQRFPYHVLFCEELDGVRVMVVRHHRRNPSFGILRR